MTSVGISSYHCIQKNSLWVRSSLFNRLGIHADVASAECRKTVVQLENKLYFSYWLGSRASFTPLTVINKDTPYS